MSTTTTTSMKGSIMMVATRIPVDSVRVPDDICRLCSDWHGGMGCMLYAVASSGNLTIGTDRPYGADSDEKWYLSIWTEFSVDMGCAARIARDSGHEDADDLEDAERWIDSVCDDLAASYGLEDWDGWYEN